MIPELPIPPEVEVFPELNSENGAPEFLKIQHELCDRQYWQVLRWLWIRHGGSIARIKGQKELLLADRDEREHLMLPEEHVRFEELDSEVRVFHGTSLDAEALGWSWSLDFHIAFDFARRRFINGPRVVEGRCSKMDAAAYFPSYDENELVVDPDLVRDKIDLTQDELFGYRP